MTEQAVSHDGLSFALDAVVGELDCAINERDASVALLMTATLLLKSLTPKHHDAPSIEAWHERVGELVLRIDAADARRRAEGTLR